ncbi:MAG TPA: 7-carboxy-7-deazaguanine synthase QueE [Candidatus Bathyarchaeia archaeon]|nr:7-carboxy-7-deazaguanine synthase QueE [Candidatus Bathyarchaeia archaeon]
MLLNPNTIQLSEIFTSIEGEGILFGTKTLFVRMAGCHLKCRWCDTSYALPMYSGNSYSIDYVKKLIADHLQPFTYKVNFTGGEPLVQHEAVIELAKFVREKGLTTYLESACYDSDRFAKLLPYIDICKVEFKMSDSEVVDMNHYDKLLQNEIRCLMTSVSNRKITYIKIVVTNSTDTKEFAVLVGNIFQHVSTEDIDGFVIQPSDTIDKPTTERLLRFYDIVCSHYPEVRIIPQLHKQMGAR